MKKYLFTIILILQSNFLCSQILVGKVIYKDIGEPIESVIVRSLRDGANQTKSDKNGAFQLEFQDKTPGSVVYLTFDKPGYRLINRDPGGIFVELIHNQAMRHTFEMMLISEWNKLTITYVRSQEKIIEDYRQEILRLTAIVQNMTITSGSQDDLRLEISKLTNRVEQIEKNKYQIAETFANITFNDAPEFVKESLLAFQGGNIERALSILTAEKLDAYWNEVSGSSTNYDNRHREQAIENYMIKGRFLALFGDYSNAYNTFFSGVSKNPSNSQNLLEIGAFCFQLNQQGLAITWFGQALHFSNDDALKMVALNGLMTSHLVTDNISEAKRYINKGLSLIGNHQTSNSVLWNQSIASFYNDLGVFYKDQKMFPEAEAVFIKALEITEGLYPDDAFRSQVEMSGTQLNLADAYLGLSRVKDARNIYESIIDAERGLSNSLKGSLILSSAYLNQGDILQEEGRLKQAESSHLKALDIAQYLYRSNPLVYAPELARTENNVGYAYAFQNDLPKAKEHYLYALELNRELSKLNTDIHLKNVALNLNNLGYIHIRNGEFDKAESDLMEALQIREKLSNENPSRFQLDKVRTLIDLGYLFKERGQFESALKYFSNALRNRQEFDKVNPQVPTTNLAEIYYELGFIYSMLDSLDKAKTVSLKALEIERSESNTKDFLAEILNNLGLIYQDMGELDESENVFLESIELKKEMALTKPGTYELELGHSYSNISLLYGTKEEFNLALKFAKQSENIFRKNNDAGVLDYDLASVLVLQAMALSNLGKQRETENALKKANRVFRKYKNEDRWKRLMQTADSLSKK